MADRLLAEFATADAAAAVIRQLREQNYRAIEAYLPFPSHEVEDALGARPSRLPIAIFTIAISGAAAAYLLEWLTTAFLYPLVVGGRPPHFPLAYLIITFEMGILSAGLTAFFGTLGLGRLFRLVDDVQGTPGFESVTRDAFWVEVSMTDDQFDVHRTPELLSDGGALRIERAGGLK
jgi:hypothetical protein